MSTLKRVMVGGGRDFTCHRTFSNVMSLIEQSIGYTYEIIEGGARGADNLAFEYAKFYNHPHTQVRAQWDLYGKSAGIKRNIKMIDMADVAIIFWDGRSKGSKHAFNYAMSIKPQSTFLYLY